MEVLCEDIPKVVEDFDLLALESLEKARKSKDSASELWFAALLNFYWWTLCQGCISTSHRVACNHGRGEAFSRKLCKHAHLFEKNQSLEPSWRGKHITGCSMLNDEDIYMGIQCWLCTVETAKVTPFLLKKHANEILLPAFSKEREKSICSHTATR